MPDVQAALFATKVAAMVQWGPCVRRIPTISERPLLYLTFDDGPMHGATSAVLDVLSEHDCPATFFLVAKRAEQHRGLVSRMIHAGHGVGNHSLDHTWGPYFRSARSMLRWIDDAERRLEDLCGGPTAGFRSPAGVRTPLMHWALAELNIPLVHWDLRSFDRILAWTRARAMRGLDGARPGSIVLLHDTQPHTHIDGFVDTLHAFIREARRRGLEFGALDRAIVEHALCLA